MNQRFLQFSLSIEAYRFEDGAWRTIGSCSRANQTAVPPFETVALDLKRLSLPMQLGVDPALVGTLGER